MIKNKKLGFVLLAVIIPLIPLQIYLVGSWYSFFSDWTLGIVLGLISYTYFLMVLILSARIRFLDRLFGQDRIMVFHGILAFLGIIFAYVHHLLKELHLDEADLQSRLGSASFLIFLIVIVLTLLFMVPNILHRIKVLDRLRLFVNNKLKLGYTFFKILHNITAIAIILISIHVIMASTTQEDNFRLSYISVTFGLSLIAYIYHKFLRPFVNNRRQLIVTDAIRLSSSIVQIEMKPKEGQVFKYKAGQFAFFRFLSRDTGYEEHPFTLSSHPEKDTLSITVKDLGDFTHRLLDIKTGEKVIIDGMYGQFSPSFDDSPQLFIAGGIGITPFYAIVHHLALNKTFPKITLVWACRSQEDLIYHKYFLQCNKEWPQFNYIPILSDQTENWKGETGFVTGEWLDKKVDLISQSEVYLCGPPLMMRLVTTALTQRGNKHIHSEKFSL